MQEQRQGYDREASRPDPSASAEGTGSLPTEANSSRRGSESIELRPNRGGWNRRPLKARDARGRAPHTELEEARGEASQTALEEARAEAIELRAMLVLARETSQRQRVALGDLHQRLAEGASENETLHDLQAQVARADSESAFLKEENKRLAEKLAEQDTFLRAHSEEVAALADRLEAQERALLSSREACETERARHAKSLETLARLRHMLDGETGSLAEPIVASIEPIETAPPLVYPEATSLWRAVEAEGTHTGLPDEARVERGRPAPIVEPSSMQIHAAQSPPRAYSGPTSAHWLDERVRASFGPLGADRLADLIRGVRRIGRPARETEAHFLLLSRDVSDTAPRLAEALLASGEPDFTLHYAAHTGTLRSDAALWPIDAPIHALIAPSDPIGRPEDLDSLLRKIRPDGIICQDFLTHEVDVQPWLDRLACEVEDGCPIVFVERVGSEPAPLPEPVQEMVERIWSRMPDRYRVMPDGHLGSWSETFHASLDRPANGLYDALRERMRPELTDRFGHLALAFVDSPISRHFDPSAERDQRFLAQLAELDEHRIEAGEVPALAFIARVDPDQAD